MKKNFISKSLNKYETLRKTSNTSERDRVHLPYLGIAAAGFLRGSALTHPCMLASSGRQAGMLALEPTV